MRSARRIDLNQRHRVTLEQRHSQGCEESLRLLPHATPLGIMLVVTQVLVYLGDPGRPLQPSSLTCRSEIGQVLFRLESCYAIDLAGQRLPDTLLVFRFCSSYTESPLSGPGYWSMSSYDNLIYSLLLYVSFIDFLFPSSRPTVSKSCLHFAESLTCVQFHPSVRNRCIHVPLLTQVPPFPSHKEAGTYKIPSASFRAVLNNPTRVISGSSFVPSTVSRTENSPDGCSTDMFLTAPSGTIAIP